jgi:hypothetical protein
VPDRESPFRFLDGKSLYAEDVQHGQVIDARRDDPRPGEKRDIVLIIEMVFPGVKYNINNRLRRYDFDADIEIGNRASMRPDLGLSTLPTSTAA